MDINNMLYSNDFYKNRAKSKARGKYIDTTGVYYSLWQLFVEYVL